MPDGRSTSEILRDCRVECIRLREEAADGRMHLSILSAEFVQLRTKLAAAVALREFVDCDEDHGRIKHPCSMCEAIKDFDTAMKPSASVVSTYENFRKLLADLLGRREKLSTSDRDFVTGLENQRLVSHVAPSEPQHKRLGDLWNEVYRKPTEPEPCATCGDSGCATCQGSCVDPKASGHLVCPDCDGERTVKP